MRGAEGDAAGGGGAGGFAVETGYGGRGAEGARLARDRCGEGDGVWGRVDAAGERAVAARGGGERALEHGDRGGEGACQRGTARDEIGCARSGGAAVDLVEAVIANAGVVDGGGWGCVVGERCVAGRVDKVEIRGVEQGCCAGCARSTEDTTAFAAVMSPLKYTESDAAVEVVTSGCERVGLKYCLDADAVEDMILHTFQRCLGSRTARCSLGRAVEVEGTISLVGWGAHRRLEEEEDADVLGLSAGNGE